MENPIKMDDLGVPLFLEMSGHLGGKFPEIPTQLGVMSSKTSSKMRIQC